MSIIQQQYKTFYLLAVILVLSLLTFSCSRSKLTAEAKLINPEGKEIGYVLLEEIDTGGVKISLKIKNLPEGTHAFHIHEKGICEPPDFKKAGGHYNPFNKEHGLKNPNGPHAGDLPNIGVGKNGRMEVEITAKLVTLKKGKKNSLFKEGGTSFVIHAGADDYTSNPSGMAGPRIACGIIKKKMNDYSMNDISIINNSKSSLPKEVVKLYRQAIKIWNSPPDIQPDEALDLYRKKKAVFIDIREKKEQDISIIPGALTIEPGLPINNIINKINKSQEVIIYCTIGSRSGKLTVELVKEGYNAKNLACGILGWTYVKGPLVDPDNQPTKRVHTYGKKWSKAAKGYQAVY